MPSSSPGDFIRLRFPVMQLSSMRADEAILRELSGGKSLTIGLSIAMLDSRFEALSCQLLNLLVSRVSFTCEPMPMLPSRFYHRHLAIQMFIARRSPGTMRSPAQAMAMSRLRQVESGHTSAYLPSFRQAASTLMPMISLRSPYARFRRRCLSRGISLPGTRFHAA